MDSNAEMGRNQILTALFRVACWSCVAVENEFVKQNSLANLLFYVICHSHMLRKISTSVTEYKWMTEKTEELPSSDSSPPVSR